MRSVYHLIVHKVLKLCAWIEYIISSKVLLLQLSCSVVSNSLRPHGLQHARLPCPSPTPEACSNSCPSSCWCHPTISHSIIPLSSCLHSFPASDCCLLTCIQISQEAGKVVWYTHLFKNFPQFVVTHTVKEFSIVNKVEVWNSLAFLMIQGMLAIWSLVPLPSLNPTNIWKFTVHVLLKPGLENFEHYFASVGDESNCAVVWTLFGIAFL